MTNEALVDGWHASTTSPGGSRQFRGRSQRALGAAPESRGTAADPPGASLAPLERALEVSRERLRAAHDRVEALETERSLLEHEVVLLQRTVMQLRRFACHDELTGLPNRRLLMDRFNQAVALASRRNRRVALLFLDLDGFKKINDAHGHAAGDAILRHVAERLRACLRASDTACRYGGDEFVVLLPELQGRESALAAARKIRARIAAPCMVDGAQITVTASIGVAVYPADGRAYDDLMRATDGCMYRDKAREAGRRAAAQAIAPPLRRPGWSR